jgi:hypothetical protein
MQHQFWHLIIAQLVWQPKCELIPNDPSMYIIFLRAQHSSKTSSSPLNVNWLKRNSLKVNVSSERSHKHQCQCQCTTVVCLGLVSKQQIDAFHAWHFPRVLNWKQFSNVSFHFFSETKLSSQNLFSLQENLSHCKNNK